jgi:hypothetical protein
MLVCHQPGLLAYQSVNTVENYTLSTACSTSSHLSCVAGLKIWPVFLQRLASIGRNMLRKLSATCSFLKLRAHVDSFGTTLVMVCRNGGPVGSIPTDSRHFSSELCTFYHRHSNLFPLQEHMFPRLWQSLPLSMMK